MKLVTKLAASTAVVGAIVSGTTTLNSAPAQAALLYNYGAIAVADNGATGRSWDYASQGAANRAALNACGYSDCDILAQFTNGCGAVAESPWRFSGGAAPDLRTARARALRRAGGGHLIVWQCTSRHL